MLALLSGVMAMVALSPLPFTDWLGLIWLTPYLLTLHSSQRLRMRLGNAIISAGLPAVYVMAGAVPQAPLTSLISTGLWITPFLAAALLVPQTPNIGLLPRALIIAASLLTTLSVIRETGMPASLSLLAPITAVSASIVASGGILLLDALIFIWQVALASLCMLCVKSGQSHQLMRTTAHLGAAALLLALIPQFPASTKSDTESIAIVQTANALSSRDSIVLGDSQSNVALARQRLVRALENLDADWAIWPESSYPSLIAPHEWARPSLAPGEVQHGYAYISPGKLQSLVFGQTPEKKPIRIEKRNPLPFAESAVQKPTTWQPSIEVDGRRASILVCSDALVPAVVRAERKRGTKLIITPSNSAYLGTGLLGRLQQKAIHLMSVHQGVPIIYVTNGGPSAVLHPNGHALLLLPANRASVAVIKPPFAKAGAMTDAALTLAISVGAWILLAMASSYAPAISLNQKPTCRRSIRSLIIAAFVLAVAASSGPSLPTTPAAAQPDQSTQQVLDTNAHQRAIAAVAWRFGHPVTAAEIPSDGAHALHWLCQKTGLIPRLQVEEQAAAPAIGLVDVGYGLEIVDWTESGNPFRLDSQTAQPHPIDQKNASIHWLSAVNSREDCRLADGAWRSMNGTRQPPVG